MAEVGCSRSEVIARKSLYRSYFLHSLAPPFEEALANARVYRQVVRHLSSNLQFGISTWMRHQGSGYRDFERWAKARLFEKGCDRVVQYMVEPIPAEYTIPMEFLPADFLFAGLSYFKIPTQLVIDTATTGMGILKPFPKDYGTQIFIHTDDHPPIHIHIQQPPGGHKTRYLWPGLVPYPGDKRLSSSGEKHLRRYVKKYEFEIQRKIEAVYRPG